MPADVQIRFKADSENLKRDLNSLQNEFKQLGVEGKVASDKISSISSGIEAAVNSPQTKSGMDHFRNLIKNIGNLFKVALFDVPVGFFKETFRILGRQKPPPFIEDLQAELRSLNITIESATAGIESATRPIAALDKVLGILDSTFANTSGSLAYYQVLLEALQPELDRVNVRLAQKRAAYVALVREGTDPASTSFNQLTAQIEILEGKSNDLTKQVVGLEKNIAAADVETRNFQSSTETFGGALSDVDTRLLSFNERTSILQETLRSLPPEITGVTDNFDVLAPTAERVNAIFDNLNTSLVDTQQELGLLDTATRLIIQDLQDLDGLASMRAVIADRTDVHNANLIRQGISEAVGSLRDYNAVMSDGIVNFREVVDISKDVTASVRTQASAFDELRRSVDGVSESQSRLQGQQLGSGIFDPFDARTPGSDFGTSFADNLRPLQAQIGQELASQAISTAGELRRIERDRVESLADLEQEYSDRILAINEVKRQKLAEVEQAIETERVRRLASIQQAFDAAKEAEISARQAAADRILAIEEDAADARNRLGVQLNQNIFALEQERDARIRELNAGLVERARERQQEILTITERATQARTEAEQRYADRVQEINNRLVEQVRDIQRGLQAEIESLESGFVQRHADRADEIVRITQAAADARTAANQTFTETMEGIYTDLVTAWDALEDGFTERQADRAQERITIEQRATDARVAANEDYADTIARISTDLVDEVRRIESEIVDVQQRHADDRFAIEQESIESRAEANETYARRLEEIEADRDSQLEENHRRLAAIQATAAGRRLDAERDLAGDIQAIQNRLVDEVTDIQQGLNDTLNDLREDTLDAERDRQARLVDLHADTQQKLEELERDRAQTIEALNEKLQDNIFDANVRAQRDRQDQLVDIERDLNDTLNDLREDTLDAERDRQARLVDLHAETQQKLEDLERKRTQTVEDLDRKFEEDRADARNRNVQKIADVNSDSSLSEEERAERREKADRELTRRLLDLGRAYNRSVNELGIQQNRQREDLARQAAAKEVEIAERTQAQLAAVAHRETEARAADEAARAARVASIEEALARRIEGLTRDLNRRLADVSIETRREREDLAQKQAAKEVEIAERAQAQLSGIAQQQTDARTQAESGIADAESAAGLAFRDAQANYVPALSAHEQALLAHAETLNRINQASAAATEAVNPARSVAIQAGFDDAAAAAKTLSETLSAVTAAELERLGVLGTETSAALTGLEDQRSAAETRTGLTFDEALANYTAEVPLNTQALQALTAALDAADIERHSALGALDAAGSEDRFTTQTAQRELAVGAGVSIEDARLNFAPALSSATQATLILNETMRGLDASFQGAIAEIQSAGLVDRQSVDDAIQTAIAAAVAQQTALETQAGTTFAEGSAAFTPGLSDISQAGFDRDITLGDIDRSETTEIDALNAQSIADRLETDAALTETRDAFLKASAQETLKYQTDVRQINNAMLLDIRAVKETLKVTLGSIDDKLDTELAEIRELKTVFDTKISAMITAINEQGNLDVANLKADTAAMRSSLEAIAEEARNNQWKSALAKIANVGIQVTGVAVGTAVGAPQVGLVAGQLAGGLVEQGVNELFHFESTDAIAHRMARSAAFRRPRAAPAYLPDSNQIKNSRDVSREIVAGLTEGLEQRSRRDGGFGGASQQAGLPEEITATVQIIFPDGTVQEIRDQMLRLEQQDR